MTRDQGWSVVAARGALEVACKAFGLIYERYELLRFGHTAIYRLLPDPLVARVARPGSETVTRREMDFCSWLGAKEFPIATPSQVAAPDPMLVHGASVSFWHWIEHEPGVQVGFEDFGRLLRRFHDETASYPGELAPWKPLAAIARDLRELATDSRLDSNDIELLWRWQAHLERRLTAVASELGIGPLYGAAHLGNAVQTPAGPALSDPEHLCMGPREWDLIPMALGPRRFGGPRDDYFDFCRGYGYDVTKASGFDTLVMARELLVTVWRLRDEMASAHHAEGERRLRYWRRDPDAPMWKPF